MSIYIIKNKYEYYEGKKPVFDIEHGDHFLTSLCTEQCIFSYYVKPMF